MKSTMSNPEQIRVAFDRLPRAQKLRLVKVFERATWADRFAQVVRHIRRHARKYPPISDEEIVRICREVRRDMYELTHPHGRR